MRSENWSRLLGTYLVLCVVLGGASAGGAVANAVLQVSGLLIILGLVWTGRLSIPAAGRAPMWLALSFVGLALLSLVPVPFSFWESLPFRADLARAMELLGVSTTSMPLSLSAPSTIESLLWIIPPAAIFLGVASLSLERRRLIPRFVVAGAVLSLALGVLQFLSGANSRFYLYDVTNRGWPVGFFANINHQVTLLLCAILCGGFLAASFATRRDRARKAGGTVATASILLFLTSGVAMAGSMAGYGLFLPAAFIALLIYRRAVAGPLTRLWKAGLAAVMLVFLGAALFGPINQQALSSKFEEAPTSRAAIWSTTIDAAEAAFPVGTGLGTFADVYRHFEDPSLATSEYVNHAHNDYLELLLEMGVFGAILLVIFILWWLIRTVTVWRDDFNGASLARLGSAIIAIVLLHSLVDYPIRTSAIAAVFALACALMSPAPLSARPAKSKDADDQVRHLEAE